MQPLSAGISEIRQRVLLLKEIPPLPMIAQRILSLPPEADVREMAEIIEQSPELSARLLGMANSAYFAWPGGVHTIHDAIYKVLGFKLVKSLVLGVTLSEVFDIRKCRGFRVERYWFTAIATAQMSQGLFQSLPPFLRWNLDNIHMNGLLHNLGMAVLAHLYPGDLSAALEFRTETAELSTTEKIRNVLGLLPTQAGGWLARKWHLPRDVVFVMEHHKEKEYRGDFWPISLLVGYCERQAQRLFTGTGICPEPETEALLGIDREIFDRMCLKIDGQLDNLLSMASYMATGERNG